MDFRATPTNVVLLMLAALAACAAFALFKRRLESNLPLLFYCAAMAFIAATGREINSALFIGGLAGACMLRFEFMNRWVTNVVWTLELAAMSGIVFLFIAEAFGIRRA